QGSRCQGSHCSTPQGAQPRSAVAAVCAAACGQAWRSAEAGIAQGREGQAGTGAEGQADKAAQAAHAVSAADAYQSGYAASVAQAQGPAADNHSPAQAGDAGAQSAAGRT